VAHCLRLNVKSLEKEWKSKVSFWNAPCNMAITNKKRIPYYRQVDFLSIRKELKGLETQIN
jgi:hypothetical protein